jgi:hypothetical protein
MPLRRRGTHELRHDDPIDHWPMLLACHGAFGTLEGWIRGRRCYVGETAFRSVAAKAMRPPFVVKGSRMLQRLVRLG